MAINIDRANQSIHRIAFEGSNPRKPYYPDGDLSDLYAEVLDVAVTALAAYVHISKDPMPIDAMATHATATAQRVGLG